MDTSVFSPIVSISIEVGDGWKDLPWPDDGGSFNDSEDLYRA